MASRLRLSTQAAFLALGLCVAFGWAPWRGLAVFYNALHVFPTLSPLPWVMLPPGGFAALGILAAFLLASLLCGRLYCSYLCPAGFLQDLAGRLGRRFFGPGLPPRGSTARFFILGLVLTLVALGSSAYHYFDHFSSMGRVFGLAHAFRPGEGAWNAALGLFFLALLLFPPLRWPRWFCGTLCPSGALFLLLQTRARLKVRLGSCRADCGACARSCPAACIAGGRIDERFCVNCAECVDACRAGGLSFAWRKPGPAASEGPGRFGRREFLTAAAVSALGAALAGWAKRRLFTLSAARVIIPPGGRSAERFLERCVACSACVSVCPTGVIVRSGPEHGVSGLGKTRLDYARAACSYECNACLGVCPSGALSYFPLEAKKRLRIGQSRLIRDLCIPYAFNRDCGACQEACPTGAIAMEPYKATTAPVLKRDTCIGCGACEHACPTKPLKAIVVDPLEVHTIAASPRKKKPGAARPKPAEPFPF